MCFFLPLPLLLCWPGCLLLLVLKFMRSVVLFFLLPLRLPNKNQQEAALKSRASTTMLHHAGAKTSNRLMGRPGGRHGWAGELAERSVRYLDFQLAPEPANPQSSGSILKCTRPIAVVAFGVALELLPLQMRLLQLLLLPLLLLPLCLCCI